jgi:cell division protein FtsB
MEVNNEELVLLINGDNNIIVVKKLIEENGQLKDTIAKLKENAFKTENEINNLMGEYENLENFKKFILTNFKSIADKSKEFQLQLDRMTEKYNKIQFNFENF